MKRKHFAAIFRQFPSFFNPQNTQLEIVIATAAHIPVIQQITAEVWPPTYVPIIGEEQVQYMLGRFYSDTALLQQMTEYGHTFLVGYDDGEPVAFASYSEIEPAVYKLHKLYILTSQQGKGIGRRLVDHIIADIRQRGAMALRLNVNIHNHPAMAFYERMGFQHFGDEDIDIGSGYFMNDHILQLPVK